MALQQRTLKNEQATAKSGFKGIYQKWQRGKPNCPILKISLSCFNPPSFVSPPNAFTLSWLLAMIRNSKRRDLRFISFFVSSLSFSFIFLRENAWSQFQFLLFLWYLLYCVFFSLAIAFNTFHINEIIFFSGKNKYLCKHIPRKWHFKSVNEDCNYWQKKKQRKYRTWY